MASDSVDEAFTVVDAARGRALLEHLSMARARGQATSPVSVLEQGEELLRRVDMLLEQLTELEAYGGDRATVAEVERQLSRTRDEYETVRVRAIEQDPSRTALLGVRDVTGREIRASLRDDEILIEYLVAPDRLLTFVVSRERAWTFEAEISDEDLTRRVRIARDLMADPSADSRVRDKVLGSLHNILLEPPLEVLFGQRFDRLIVVPHGVLSYLPFAALRNGATGRYVVQDFAVQVLPSAAALPVLRERTGDQPHRSIGGVAFAPLETALPATREETRAFRRTWDDGRERSGRQATEASVRQALAERQIVHVATHGVMNARHPMFSRLDLAGDAGVGSDDGRLEVHELLELRVASPLVFLSGCETGLGPSWSTGFARGEDYATLAQAFLYAGADNVVATLWPVSDAGAAVFAEDFYRALRGADPVRAIAEAQRALLTQSRYRAPYYWAPYQVLGEGRLQFGAQESETDVVTSK